MYSESGKEGVPATYQTINFIAWKPHPKQKAAAARGSGQVSLKNIAEISKLTDQMNALKRDGITDEATLAKLSEITKELEKLNATHARSGRDDSDDSWNAMHARLGRDDPDDSWNAMHDRSGRDDSDDS